MGALVPTSDIEHFSLVAKNILSGRVVPFLGAGANLCDRLPGTPRNPNLHLPSSAELAEELANGGTARDPDRCPYAECPRPGGGADLARVSQNVVAFLDEGPLYEKLHTVFAVAAPPTSVHELIAQLPFPTRIDCRAENRHPLIVTTNYDDLMETALRKSGREFDCVFFDPDHRPGGGFYHRTSTGSVRPIEDPNGDASPFCEHRPTLLKIHGTIDRQKREFEGFVITEDQYIEYLAAQPLEKLLPSTLLAKLRNNHMLFLGYSLRDWNCRVFLRRLKRDPKHRYRSWAVMRSADEAERHLWSMHGVTIIEMELSEYILQLKQQIMSLSGEHA